MGVVCAEECGGVGDGSWRDAATFEKSAPRFHDDGNGSGGC